MTPSEQLPTNNIEVLNPISEDVVKEYKNYVVPWGFGEMGYITYKRTYARQIPGENRSEEWAETLARCVNGAQEIGAKYTQEEALRLYDYIFNLKGSFAGRSLWLLGTDLVRKIGAPGLQNCYYTNLECIEDFEFLMTMLTLGGGVGFSVERSKVHNFPKVKDGVVITHALTKDADIIVPDSRNGWVKLLKSTLESFFYTGQSFTYSTILVRGKGEPLVTFGGTASGPQALIDGITDICTLLSSRAGKKIRSVEALDIANIIGRLVVAGSSRRSSELASGDPDDILFLRSKNWGRGNIPGWRSQSNNSIYADSFEEILDEVWAGYDGSGEPFGLLNRKLARTIGRIGEPIRDHSIDGYNPCGEVPLASGESCNLATIFLPNITSKKELFDLSVLLYKTQKAITSLKYPFKRTEEIVRKNRRLGQSITGWLQASEEQLGWAKELYPHLREFDRKWSAQQGINPSIKLTTCQPSGTLSLVGGCIPGIHPAYARHYIRRIRMGSHDPLVKHCRDRGYHVQFDIGIDGKELTDISVVSFPCKSPDNAILAKDITAIQQMGWMVKVSEWFVDNAVSQTVYYSKEELPGIKNWLKENYEKKIKSISFLLREDHGFALAPYEEITEEHYNRLVSSVVIVTGPADIGNGLLDDPSCVGGICPIR